MNTSKIYRVVDILVLGAATVTSLAGHVDLGVAGISIYLTGKVIRGGN